MELTIAQHEELHEELKKGIELYISKNYRDSLHFFLNFDTQNKPLKAEIRRDYYIARNLYHLKFYISSIPFYVTTIHRTNINPLVTSSCQNQLFYELAYSMYRSSFYKSSLRVCEHVLPILRSQSPFKTDPFSCQQALTNFKNMMRLRILNLIQLHHLPEATERIQFFLVKYPQDPDCLSYRAILQKFDHKYIECLKTMNKVISLEQQDEKSWKHYYFRGRLFEEIGDYARSLDDFKLCLRMNPKCYDCLRRISELYERFGEVKKAKKYMKNFFLETDETARTIEIMKLGNSTSQNFV